MNKNRVFFNEEEVLEPLNQNELEKLFNEFSNGSILAFEKLFLHNMKLVLMEVFHKFKDLQYDKEDLISIGKYGLVKAINTYDISKKYAFSSYATRCIDNEILMFLRKQNRTLKTESLDRIIYSDLNETDITLFDVISDDNSLENDYELKEVKNIIRKLVDNLDGRKKEIVKLYFGFYNNHSYTQVEISKILNISQAHVSRIIIKSLKELKDNFYQIDADESLVKLKNIM